MKASCKVAVFLRNRSSKGRQQDPGEYPLLEAQAHLLLGERTVWLEKKRELARDSLPKAADSMWKRTRLKGHAGKGREQTGASQKSSFSASGQGLRERMRLCLRDLSFKSLSTQEGVFGEPSVLPKLPAHPLGSTTGVCCPKQGFDSKTASPTNLISPGTSPNLYCDPRGSHCSHPGHGTWWWSQGGLCIHSPFFL